MSDTTNSTKRSFTREFKLTLVRQLISGEKRMAQICRENNLAEGVVRRWREQYQSLGEEAWVKRLDSQPAVHVAPDAKIAQLEAALGRAHLEIEFLRQVLEKKGSAPPKARP
jgi:transposase